MSEVNELNQKLGLETEPQLDVFREENICKDLTSSAKDTVEEIEETIQLLKGEVHSLLNKKGNEEDDTRERRISIMVDSLAKMYGIKQKFTSHILDIDKKRSDKSKNNMDDDFESTGTRLTTDQIKHLTRQKAQEYNSSII